jgi:hypothetical protein
MAEYIDRNGLIRLLDNIQQPKMPITKGFKYISIEEAIRVVSERQTVKVIPLDKIKQAREEMNKLASHKVRPISFDQSVAIDMCIGILDKLIEESEE